jgi:hypothetical protein
VRVIQQRSLAAPRECPVMARYRFTAYENDTLSRYVVIWNLQ